MKCPTSTIRYTFAPEARHDLQIWLGIVAYQLKSEMTATDLWQKSLSIWSLQMNPFRGHFWCLPVSFWVVFEISIETSDLSGFEVSKETSDLRVPWYFQFSWRKSDLVSFEITMVTSDFASFRFFWRNSHFERFYYFLRNSYFPWKTSNLSGLELF
jgi:hypothetical protein